MNQIDSIIRDYIRGTLDPSQKEEVEVLIDTNVDWQKEYTFQLQLRQAAEDIEKEKVVTLLNDHEHGKLFSRSNIAIFSIILIISLMTIWLLSKSQSEDPIDTDAVFASHYAPMTNRVAPLTRSNQEDTLSVAFSEYDLGAYDDAYQLLSAWSNPTDIRFIDLYRGIALVELERYKEALSLLESMPLEEEPWGSEVLWYRSLILIKLNRLTEATTILQVLIDRESTPDTIKSRSKTVSRELGQ